LARQRPRLVSIYPRTEKDQTALKRLETAAFRPVFVCTGHNWFKTMFSGEILKIIDQYTY